MGLFDFAREIGNKIFASEEEAPDKIKQHVEEDNPGINNLEVDVKDGVATLKGETDDPSAFEKAILMVGNIFGIGEVRADEVVAPPQTIEVQYYEIVKGDSLWKIAASFYDDGSQYPRIFEANREIIKDPKLIFPGQKIRIPFE